MISCGSQWRRWEPHIHTPETVLNNQFKGEDPWGNYVTTIEELSPKIEALGITDYYVTDNYIEIIRRKNAGRLPDVGLIFPNVELRLDVAAKSGFVNIHFLVSPEDPEHVAQLQRILTRLQFNAFGDCFDCTRDELIRLGKRADSNITDDIPALRHGATQFKVNFNQLREVYQKSDWAKKNILIAVAGGKGDGTSGLRQAADTTMRAEIEMFSHVIFASSSAQREFWLGQRSASFETLRERYNGCKPCLHGSDSHDPQSIGKPTDNRFSWIKGELEYDSLRQACIDPEWRAFVGSEPPPSGMPSQAISHVSIENAEWAKMPKIPLNPGLVAVIGARGSGKTALADMIAAGCDSIPSFAPDAYTNTSPSFLVRARPLLKDSAVTLTWGGGAITNRSLDGRDSNNSISFPRCRYLSQQFVEELCSSSGISDGLIEEIERVILEAHSVDERAGLTIFSEFREFRTSRFRQARSRETEAISDISDRIAVEFEKQNQVANIAQQIIQKRALVQGYTSDRARLFVTATDAQVKYHERLSEAAQTLREQIQGFNSQRSTFVALQDEVQSTRATRAPELLRQAKERHRLSGLDEAQWDEFLLIYKGQVEDSLVKYIAWADDQIAKLTGTIPQVINSGSNSIGKTLDIGALDLVTLTAEVKRLEALFSADKIVRDQYAALTKRLEEEGTNLKALEVKLSDARGARDRRKALQVERDDAYKRSFEAIIDEQTSLSELYAPLMKRLEASSGTLGKLGFYVKRVVDTTQWAEFAEENLLDLRKAGPFTGRGSLTILAKQLLQPVWESGTAANIKLAMTNFIASYQESILTHAAYNPTQQSEYKAWLKRFAHWLFSTDHISVRYEIVYDNTDIRLLSPGTRGIVLLLLYLALDEADDRPLIIDQPEENLDPKSVNDELVPLFIAAKLKRQIIMVTHNANLVINTNADQVIVAEVGPHQEGMLPPITYYAGGLENATVRKSVCDILEGGETAFKERARRLRVRLDR